MSKQRQQMQQNAQAEVAAAQAAAQRAAAAPKAHPLDAKYDAANPYLKALKGDPNNAKLKGKADGWEAESSMWNEEAAKREIQA